MSLEVAKWYEENQHKITHLNLFIKDAQNALLRRVFIYDIAHYVQIIILKIMVRT